jgi:hypothetical protein
MIKGKLLKKPDTTRKNSLWLLHLWPDPLARPPPAPTSDIFKPYYDLKIKWGFITTYCEGAYTVLGEIQNHQAI